MKRNNAWLAWALAVGLMAYLVGAAVPGQSSIDAPGVITAYASGTALHADAIQGGLTGPRIVGADLAFSAANANSAGFSAINPQNEMQLFLQPEITGTPFSGKNASARGAGLELGLGSDLPTGAGDVIQETFAGQVAPPNGPAVVKDDGLGSALAPLVFASLLHSEAAARFDENPCLSSTSQPIAFGRGYAADAQLLNTGGAAPDGRFETPVVATDDPNPDRSVVDTKSYVYAAPNTNTTGGQHYGLVSEIHETYAPVTLLRMAPAPALIIEVLGEWVFKTTVTGVADNLATPTVNEGAKIEYYTLDKATGQPVTPTTDVIRVSQDGGATYSAIQAQQVFGAGGLVLPPELAPILGLAIGEDPRAIAAPGATPDPASTPTIATNGTSAAGAVDVVRLELLGLMPGLHVAGLRIGHFESRLTVPAGGFTCTVATTTTTAAPTTTTTLAPSTTTTTAAPGATTTTIRPATTTTTAKPITTTTTAPPGPGPAPVARPVRVQPNTVG